MHPSESNSSQLSGKTRLWGDAAMLLAALVWGTGFVAQRYAAEHLHFFAYNGVRFLLAGLVLLPLGVRFMGKPDRRLFWIVPAGVLLYLGSAFQQAGLKTTSAGAAAFITGLYVVLVPVYLALIWRERIPLLNWIAPVAALLGTYLLSTGGQAFSPSQGDLLVLVGAFLWPFHVIVVGLAVQRLDLLAFSVGQILLCAALNLVSSLFVDPPTWPAVAACWPAVLYGGLLSVAAGFTLQAIGQRRAPTTDAALIMSFESVFAAVAGAVFLAERMNAIQMLGCFIIMSSILAARILSLYRLSQRGRAAIRNIEFPEEP